VKREDGKNKPCRGKVNVTLRESQMSCDEARVEIEQLTQERDEARAEIEHWKGAAKEHAENHAAAVEAFHDATRLRSEIQQARIAAEIERDEARAEVERLKEALEDAAGDMHQRIRAGYDKTIADCWRAKVAEVEKQRDDAYRRGAEAMREAAANAIPSHYSGDFIRALPIPEDKP
jgi:cell division protein ZapA (FtsZ GTPase activity inhibitor)